MADLIYLDTDGIIKYEGDTGQGYSQDVGGVTYYVTDNANLVADLEADKDVCTTLVDGYAMEYLFRADGDATAKLTGPEGYLASHDITSWDTSSVTSMRYMFYASSFNQDIGNWDVSSVTIMTYMFGNATSFNQPIENWDVSSVKDMRAMFYNATSFNQPIENWDVSSVIDMRYMFYATSFNKDIGNWDVSSVTDMQAMFSASSSFNQPIENWDVSSVIDMSYMFYSSPFNQDLSRWAVPLIASIPTNFDNDGDNPTWGKAPYPHIKFQEKDNQPCTVKIYSDEAKTQLVAELTTNSRGFTQYYMPEDNKKYYFGG